MAERSKRTPRKKTAPTRLREESWYLVRYEDDCNMRVLQKDEVHHIFPEDNEEEFQVGDVVSALWLPDGKYYDAELLQIGVDKNELMKERLQLEKAKKSEKTSKVSVEKKRKQPSEPQTEGQRKEKKSQKQKDDKENEQKAKEREEKKRKKEEDKQRQEFLLETRKSQATARWASNSSIPGRGDHDVEDEAVTIVAEVHSIPAVGFTPVPLRNRNSTVQAGVSSQRERDANSGDASSTPTLPSLPPAKRQKSTSPLNDSSASISHSPTLSRSTSKESTQPPHQRNTCANEDETPKRPCNKEKSNCDTRRGLHFQSSIVESCSEDEDTADHCMQDNPGVPRGNCCREQRLENEALRKRIQKLHRRLDIALKAKTTAEVMSNRPAPGVLDHSLATEYKMVELVEGSAVYWYSQHRAYCSAFKNWSGYINAAVDIFFSKEKLSSSCAMGNEKKSKTGDVRQPLNSLIVQAIIGKVCSKFSKDGIMPSQVVQKINMKCVEARRPQRTRVTAS